MREATVYAFDLKDLGSFTALRIVKLGHVAMPIGFTILEESEHPDAEAVYQDQRAIAREKTARAIANAEAKIREGESW